MGIFLRDEKITYDTIERSLSMAADRELQIFYLTKNENILLESLINGVEKKADLISAIWPDRKGFISDSSFYKTVFMLRKSLCQAGLSQDCIKTRSGYGLILNIQAIVQTTPISCVSISPSLPVEKLTCDTEETETRFDDSEAYSKREESIPEKVPPSRLLRLLTSVRIPQIISCLSLAVALYFTTLYFYATPLPERNWVEVSKQNEQTFYTLNTVNINTQKIIQRIQPIFPDIQQKGHYYLVETPIAQSVTFCHLETSVQPCKNYLSIGY